MSSSPLSSASVRIVRKLPFPAERVFDAWLDPRLAGKFLFATEAGEMVKVEIEPRVGGRFVITERRGDVNVEHVGEYREIERPHRLVFTFQVPQYSQTFDLVTITIRPLDEGCELTLEQEMSPEWIEHKPKIENGWSMIIAGLTRTLEA